jgi:quinol monooxygenase YgiN
VGRRVSSEEAVRYASLTRACRQPLRDGARLGNLGSRAADTDHLEEAMGFIQIIEFHTSKADEAAKLDDQWEQATAGKRTTLKATHCVDRNDASRHFVIVEFPSYEAAMKNSELPETSAMAEKMAKICDGPPTFYDLDVTNIQEG